MIGTLSCLPRPQDGFSALLRRHGGSRRNSLLRWCQSRTQGYKVREEHFVAIEIYFFYFFIFLIYKSNHLIIKCVFITEY